MDWVKSILGSAVIAAALAGIAKLVEAWMAHKSGTKRERLQSMEGKIGSNSDGISRNASDIDALKSALRVLLHDRMKQLIQSHVAEGAVAYGDRGDLIEMHGIYHDKLGGNGNLDALMEALMGLEIKKER